MDIQLESESGRVMRFTGLAWTYLSTFAELHGFEWPTDIRGDEQSTLSAIDAADMARSIARGLSEAAIDKRPEHVRADLAKAMDIESSMLEAFSSKVDSSMLSHWGEFISFAHHGGFSLHYVSTTGQL